MADEVKFSLGEYLTNQSDYAKIKFSNKYPKRVGKMALIMGKENQLLIFKALFVTGSPEYQLVEALIKEGVSFSCGLYKIIAITDEYKKTNNFPEVVLPVGTSTLIKNMPIDLDQLAVCRIRVKKWLIQLGLKHIVGYKAPSIDTTGGSKWGSKLADITKTISDTSPYTVTTAGPFIKTKETAEALKVKKDEIIVLKDANTLGQKVKGTSDGSVYYCIAFNPRVKMAVKLGSNQVSFRSESIDPTEKEKVQLNDIGLDDKGKYRSMHITTEGVSVGKVVGAVLLGCGVRFDQVITTVEDIPTKSK